ncbi:MAG: ascorbate-dependent monooxygenase [Candidatus Rokuibacteriota bacterium]|nr:MAG: ascorbate-dependent monooxygenase [Candidatus Rokubacteria bacterium]
MSMRRRVLLPAAVVLVLAAGVSLVPADEPAAQTGTGHHPAPAHAAPPATPTTQTPPAGTPAGDTPVTFNNQIVRLFQQHCQVCHRPGEAAPFSLLTHRDASPWRQQILLATRERRMPPWKPVAGHGDFAGVRRLSDADIALIARWVESGAAEGDARDLPPAREFPSGWSLGAPDLVLKPEASFEVSASARDLYRCFTIPTSFKEDRWVSAAELVPGNRKIVHHILTYIETSGISETLDKADPGLGYTCFGGPGFIPTGGLGGWAPGAPPTVMPSGVGLLLPAGARVVIQVHYHNHGGSTESDRTSIGLHFARTPVDKRARSVAVLNRTFVIPAGAARHEVRASWTVPPMRDLHAIGIAPHMHLLGRQMKVTATSPDGTTRPLISIDDWDFNWQGLYSFAQPVPLPAGTRIDLDAIFDNSPGNPRNPNSPPQDVTWGEGTTDEMAIVFLRVTADGEHLGWRPQ